MSSIDACSSGMSESLTLSNDYGTNSDIRSMILKIDSIVLGLGYSINVLVDSRDYIFDLFVTINKDI